MKGQIIGFKVIRGKKKDGTEYNGVELNIAYSDNNYVGSAVMVQYVGSNTMIYRKLSPLNDSIIGRVGLWDLVPGYGGRIALNDVEWMANNGRG